MHSKEYVKIPLRFRACTRQESDLRMNSGWKKRTHVIPVSASAVFAVFVCMMRSPFVSLHFSPFFPAWLLEYLRYFALDFVLWWPWDLTIYTAFFLTVLDQSQLVLL